MLINHDLVAPIRLSRGDRSGARELCERAIPLARWSTLAKHLLQRVYGTLIAAADSPAEAHERVGQAEETLGHTDFCFFCAVMLAVPSATACADVGDIDGALRHLAMAELSAGLWQGTAWQAAISEARGHLARAEGELPRQPAAGVDVAGEVRVAHEPEATCPCGSARTRCPKAIIRSSVWNSSEHVVRVISR